MLDEILHRYGLDESEYQVSSFGNGLINHTWKVSNDMQSWLLQKINHHIFRQPRDIMENCSRLAEYLKIHYPEYLFVAPVIAGDGNNFVKNEGQYYRLFPFIENSYTFDTVSSPAQAFEAARQFGKFTSHLSGYDLARLHITLPDFHNLSLRYQQFLKAIEEGNQTRKKECLETIRYLRDQGYISAEYEEIKKNPAFVQRVIHHDSKINNVLFDRNTKSALCIIDLDTVMPGYFISDVGDMLRTYLSPINEDDPAYEQIQVREDYFKEIARGYLGEMKSDLSPEERNHFVYAGKFAIYLQAIRFLTDYLNDDSYYSTLYEKHNLIRTLNQVTLLKRFLEKESVMNQILQLL